MRSPQLREILLTLPPLGTVLLFTLATTPWPTVTILGERDTMALNVAGLASAVRAAAAPVVVASTTSEVAPRTSGSVSAPTATNRQT